MNGSIIDTRILLQNAIKANACAVSLAHNHPIGNLGASVEKTDHLTTSCRFRLTRQKSCVFRCLINLSHPGEGWSMLPVFPHRTGKNGPHDHFMPISVDMAKVLVFRCLINLSHPGEGWSMLPVFPL